MKKNIASILLLFFTLLLSVPANAQEAREEILYVSSYGIDAKYINETISTFITSYTKLSNDGTVIAIENMNCNTIDEAPLWKDRMIDILNKHKNAKLIILMGNEAAISYFSLKDPLYQKIPVYCLMGTRYCTTLPKESNIDCLASDSYDKNRLVDMTQVIKAFNVRYASFYSYQPEELIDFARKCFPMRNNFAILSDNSFLGLTYLRTIKKVLKKAHGITFHFIDGRYRDMSNAAIRYKEMPTERTIGILCNWRVDAKGTPFMNNGVATFTRFNNAIPMFSLTGSGFGYWAIGGFLPKFKNHGEEIAERAYKEFYEREPQPVKIEIIENSLNIDKLIWDSWNLNSNLLPENTKFINKSSTFFEKLTDNKDIITYVLIVILFLLVGYMILFTITLRYRNAKNMLANKNKELAKKDNQHNTISVNNDKRQNRLKELNMMVLEAIKYTINEIKAPQEMISGSAEVLYNELTNEAHRDVVDLIRQNNRKNVEMRQTVEGAVAKLTHDPSSFNLTTIVPSEICAPLIESFKKNNSDIKFNAICEIAKPIKTDRNAFEDIIKNILELAKRIASDGIIDLKACVKQGVISIIVTAYEVNVENNSENSLRGSKRQKLYDKVHADLIISKLSAVLLGGDVTITHVPSEKMDFIFELPISENGQNDLSL